MMLGRTALGGALAALVICANTAAARAGDDDSNESFLTKFERTIGLKNPNTMEYGINYSERSPLVVPPTRDLPPPQSAAPPPVPDWPKDPDIIKRQQAKVKSQDTRPVDWIAEARPLNPDQLAQGRTTNTSGSSAAASPPTDDRYPKVDATRSLFSRDLFNKEEYATFTGEPARTSLTAPPPGYLTPSPDQPYGIGPDKPKYHVPTPSEHGELHE